VVKCPPVPDKGAQTRPQARQDLVDALNNPSKLGADFVEPPEGEEFSWQIHVLNKQPTPGDLMLMFDSTDEMIANGWIKK